MNDQTQTELVRNFLSQQDTGVLATVTADGLPEAAVVGFAETEDFNLIIGTFASSRKYLNLSKNPRVALAVHNNKGATVQYEGEAQELSGAELDEYKQDFLAKIPTAAKYVASADERFFKITPRWIRYSDWSHDPIEEFEIKF